MKTVWLTSAAALLLPTPAVTAASAQAVAQADEPSASEISGTATRRAQLLSDVPIAVSAVSMDQMRNSGATDIRQLNQLAPSLLVSSTGSEANGSARVRGVGTVGDNPGLESSVAVFIDGVYRSRSGIGLNELGELERIEVLRGPQGTLFGRNASAGLINVITAKPSFTPGGIAQIDYGNFNFWRLSASLTSPIIGDKLAGRIDGVYVKRNGFLTDQISGDTINDRDRIFVRGQLLFTPTSDLSVRLIGDYSYRDESCCAASYNPVRAWNDPTRTGEAANTNPDGAFQEIPNPILDVLQSLGGRINQRPFDRIASVTPGRGFRNTTRDWGVSGELNWAFGDFNLTSITAYRGYKAGGAGDLDYNNVDILYRADDGTSFREFGTFTQELRLQASLFDDTLDVLIGGFYSNEKLNVSDNIKFGTQYGAFASCRLLTLLSPSAALRNPAAPGCLSPTGAATVVGAFGPAAGGILIDGLNRLSTVNNVGDNGSRYRQVSENFAIFTHNVWNITDTLALTGGLRWTSERKDFSARFNSNNTACVAQQNAFSPFLPGGAAAFPAALQGFTQAVVNLTCQGNSSAALNALGTLEDTRRENEFTGTTVLSWKPTEDWLVYGSYSRGYKSGGFNLDRSALGLPIFAPTDPRNVVTAGLSGSTVQAIPFGTRNLQFDQEINNAFELGLKFSSRQFTMNVAAFRQEFRNFQLNTFNGSVFLVQTVNGCKTDLAGGDRDTSPITGGCAADQVKPGLVSQGFEVETTMSPTRDLMVTAGFTLADTKFARNLVGNQNGSALDPALFLLPGQQISNSPLYVVTGSFGWTPEIGTSGLSALMYTDFRYSSAYNTGSDLFLEKEQQGFIVVNARIGLRGPAERWALEFWAQNLLNTNFDQVAFNAPFQGGGSLANTQRFGATSNQLFASFLGEPRTYGVTLRSRF
ncbi:TonB-dependent receptor [Polymorphobacter multimanifer]|uniref:TonB-dependent receptor n=1 Tax=Polymorphobacter multimanifer TaxID=1070431 RepID=UPI001665A1C4|nr:TonB-dependent receptor [Polymorphobacter multimanifer]GGI82781.1 TonB-dependent receptor [Polymorphobacter multimanifer]